MNAVVQLPAPPIVRLVNIEAEAALLGAIMQANDIIDRVADRLRPADFAESAHSALFEIILARAAEGKPATPITISAQWLQYPHASDLGGNTYLLRLTASSDAAIVGVDGLVDIIRDLARRRSISEALREAADMASDPETGLEAVMERADAAMSDDGHSEGIEQMTAMQCADAYLESFKEKGDGVTSHTIKQLDDVLGQLRAKELVILAARPGMGKTATALSYALGAAQSGKGVMFVSLEMSGQELAARMMADLCFDGYRGVPYSAIRDRDLTSEQRRAVWKARNMLGDMPLRVIDAGKLTTGRLSMLVKRTKRRMEAKRQSLDLVIVDYLQLLSADSQSRSMYEKISEISMALKGIAKTHNVAVMALAQLSREVEKRGDKIPMLADLRDSGQIEQDADAVLFLLRPNYYHQFIRPEETDPKYPEWLAIDEKSKHDIDFIVAKRRNGVTGTATGRFYGLFQAVRGAE